MTSEVASFYIVHNLLRVFAFTPIMILSRSQNLLFPFMFKLVNSILNIVIGNFNIAILGFYHTLGFRINVFVIH